MNMRELKTKLYKILIEHSCLGDPHRLLCWYIYLPFDGCSSTNQVDRFNVYRKTIMCSYWMSTSTVNDRNRNLSGIENGLINYQQRHQRSCLFWPSYSMIRLEYTRLIAYLTSSSEKPNNLSWLMKISIRDRLNLSGEFSRLYVFTCLMAIFIRCILLSYLNLCWNRILYVWSNYDEMREAKPNQLIIVSPIAPKEILTKLKKEADYVEVIITPPTSSFKSVGQYYQSFVQVTDEQVMTIMGRRGLL